MDITKATYEKNILGRGFEAVIGIDEAGRGPWAGPVVAAGVLFDARIKLIPVADSKKISPLRRIKIFDYLVKNYQYGIGVVDNRLIDIIGILPATKLAMRQAVENLGIAPDYLLIDAVNLEQDLSIKQENIIRGDQKIWSIAAASIIAKVTRDGLMNYYHGVYPLYNFCRHKGYGTKLHQEMIDKYGICPIHRRSFKPIKDISPW